MNLQSLLIFCTDQPIIAAIIGLILILFALKKPKEFLKTLLFTVFMAVAFYVFSLANKSMMTGVDNSKEMNTKTLKSEQL